MLTFRQDEIQWVFVTLEDTFALPENLRYYVATMDPQNHHYLGHAMKFWNIIYNWAGEYTILLSNYLCFFKISSKEGFLEKKNGNNFEIIFPLVNSCFRLIYLMLFYIFH